MDEKVLAKGEFSKFNIISLLFLLFAIYFFVGIFWGIIDEDGLVGILMCIVLTFISIGGIQFFCYLFNKSEITVTNKRVYGKAAFKRRVDLPFDKISSVGTSVFNGIGVATASGKITFFYCKNRDEIFDTISNLLLERQGQQEHQETVVKQEIPQSNADELKKFKELLDNGIITQEEFDAKKKQLLGL